MEIDMIKCPKCGKLFPLGRRKLGYQFCIACTPQNYVRPYIEEQGEGEDTYTVVHIVSQQEYNIIQRGQRMMQAGRYVTGSEQEDAPDMTTYEQQDEQEPHFTSAEREARLQSLEYEQQGMTERSIEEIEQDVPFADSDFDSDNEENILGDDA